MGLQRRLRDLSHGRGIVYVRMVDLTCFVRVAVRGPSVRGNHHLCFALEWGNERL